MHAGYAEQAPATPAKPIDCARELPLDRGGNMIRRDDKPGPGVTRGQAGSRRWLEARHVGIVPAETHSDETASTNAALGAAGGSQHSEPHRPPSHRTSGTQRSSGTTS